MKSTTVLQILKTIRWKYSTHHSKDGRRPEAENAVKEYYEYNCKKFEARGITVAEIRSAFHGGDGHPKEHVTVDFQKDNGEHVTTRHVYGPKDAK